MKQQNKIQQLRMAKCISREALAEVLGVSPQTVSDWESSQLNPDSSELNALGSIFGVSADSLLNDEPLQNNTENIAYSPFWLAGRKCYEYKSKRSLFGLPLVHINVGIGAKRAKGVLAIGNIATGILSIGLVSMGLISIGLLSLGLIGLGTFAIGLLLAIGAISIGTFSIGAIAIGVFSLGAVSVGVYSIGAVAVASRVAVGDHAYAPVAIGRVAKGSRVFIDKSAGKDFSGVSAREVRQAILEEFPNTSSWILNWLTWFLG